MDKLTAILVTLIGIVLALPLLTLTFLEPYANWIIALAVLVIGVPELIKAFK